MALQHVIPGKTPVFMEQNAPRDAASAARIDARMIERKMRISRLI
jgi:hypothetical protein